MHPAVFFGVFYHVALHMRISYISSSLYRYFQFKRNNIPDFFLRERESVLPRLPVFLVSVYREISI